jgi:hypothetical protein
MTICLDSKKIKQIKSLLRLYIPTYLLATKRIVDVEYLMMNMILIFNINI